jgi:cytochrome c biogenesis protein CcdA
MNLSDALIHALATQPLLAVGLLFLYGVCNAFGPCNAQRTLGLMTCTKRSNAVSTSFFYASGIAAAGVLLVLSASFLQQLMSASHLMNGFMAVICLTLGFTGLWRADLQSCTHAKVSHSEMTALSIAALGFGSSFVIAPCCTPFILLLAAYAPAHFLTVDAIAYACGSAFPYLIGGIVINYSFLRTMQKRTRQALQIITSSLTLALGLFYCVEM